MNKTLLNNVAGNLEDSAVLLGNLLENAAKGLDPETFEPSVNDLKMTCPQYCTEVRAKRLQNLPEHCKDK